MTTAKPVQQIVNENTIEGLLKLPQDPPIEPSEVKSLTDLLWEKYQKEVRDSQVQQKDNTEEGGVRTLSFNGKLMRFTVAKQGVEPDVAKRPNEWKDGYPLVIALHGGGGTTKDDNDQDWVRVQSYWKNDVNPGLYVAVRGISDTWKLHWEDESYPLYDRLIENLIALDEVDPNKVYVLGFSAGGDGVYQIAARMADRLGAANMMAGHPNGVSVVNYRNLAFLIQMGENDCKYNRNREAARYGGLLDAQQQIRYPGLPPDQQEALGGYHHDVFLHPPLYPPDDPRSNPHNEWQSMTLATSKQPNPVISDLETWLKETRAAVPPAVEEDWDCVPTPYQVTATVDRDTASVWWLTQYAPPNNKRNPYPDRVIWDTTTRADKRTGVADNGSWFFRNQDRPYQFYWLDIGRNPEKFPQGVPPKPVYARYFKERNAIVVVDPGDHLGLLLHPEMLDLSQPVEITVGNDPPLVFQPKLTLKSLVRTLVSRGDPRFTFPARIDLEKDGASYTAVGGSTLRLEGPVGGDSGEPFLDMPPENARLTRVVVRSGDVGDAVQATYGQVELPLHGGPGGEPTVVDLAEGERITQVTGQYGTYFGLQHIAQLTIQTTAHTYSPLGSTQFTSGLPPFTFTAGPDEEIAAFHGRAATHSDGTRYLTALGVGYRKVGTRPVVAVKTVTPGVGVSVPGSLEFSGTDPATNPIAGVTVFTATVTETRPIAGVTVWVNLQHAGGGGLRIEVISPAGTPVVLSGTQGGNLDKTFDDTATTSIGGGSAQVTDSFRPEEPLSALIGESAAGMWRLRIVDATGTSTGNLPLLGWKVSVRPAVSGN